MPKEEEFEPKYDEPEEKKSEEIDEVKYAKEDEKGFYPISKIDLGNLIYAKNGPDITPLLDKKSLISLAQTNKKFFESYVRENGFNIRIKKDEMIQFRKDNGGEFRIDEFLNQKYGSIFEGEIGGAELSKLVKRLNFIHTSLTDSELVDSLNKCSNVEWLDLIYCDQLRNPDLRDLKDLNKMEYINSVGAENLMCQGLLSIVMKCPNLEEVTFHHDMYENDQYQASTPDEIEECKEWLRDGAQKEVGLKDSHGYYEEEFNTPSSATSTSTAGAFSFKDNSNDGKGSR